MAHDHVDFTRFLFRFSASWLLRRLFLATMNATIAGTNAASGSGSASSAPAASASIPSGSGQQSRSSRIAPHSHIRGLGLDNTSGLVTSSAGQTGGFVGQDMAREVSAIAFPRIQRCYRPCAPTSHLSDICSPYVLGVRCGRQPHQIPSFFGASAHVGRRARNRQNSPRACHLPRTRFKSSFLPHGRFRGVLR